MTRILLTSTENIPLIGGGPVSADILTLALRHAPRLVAADGGADRAKGLGFTPTAIIGDMDSLDKIEYWQNSDLAMYKIDEQDTTDFEKCLYSITTPLVIGVGFLGGRTDHTLAALNTLVRMHKTPVLLVGEGEVIFAAGPVFSADLSRGTPVSFFPLSRIAGLASEGLRWPIEGLVFEPDGQIGTSNEALGGRVEARFDRACMLVRLPLSALNQGIAALNMRAH